MLGQKSIPNWCEFLTEIKMPLSELVVCSEQYYSFDENQITSQTRTSHIFDVLDQCRELILSNKLDATFLNIYCTIWITELSSGNVGMMAAAVVGLNLSYGCIPFDKMPFCTSLRNHNPRIYDLLDCLSEKDREHELFARQIQNNTEIRRDVVQQPKRIIVRFW